MTKGTQAMKQGTQAMKQGTQAMTLLALIALGWPPATLQADEANDYYKFFSWFQGTWRGESEENGVKTTVTGKCDGSLGRCNIYKSKGETSVWGYDPKEKRWSGVGYLADGSRFLRSGKKPAGTAMKAGMTLTGTGTTWLADGTIHFETTTMTCIDENTARFVTQRKDQDGKSLPPVIVVSKRIK